MSSQNSEFIAAPILFCSGTSSISCDSYRSFGETSWSSGKASGAGCHQMLEQFTRLKILQIGNYPPPVCGWAIQTQLLVEEIRRRGHICEVLNINENRRNKSSEYVDVQNAFDYL